MGKRMTDAERDKMVMLNACGVSAVEIAVKTGYSEAGVSNVLSTLTLVRDGDDETLAAKIVGRSMGREMVVWAYERVGRSIPAVVDNALKVLSGRNKTPEQTTIEELITESGINYDRLGDVIYNAVYHAVKEAMTDVKN